MVTNIQQSRKDYPLEKGKSIQYMVLGKLDSHVQRNEARPFSYTIHKYKLKMVERSKCETRIHQNPRREHRQQPFFFFLTFLFIYSWKTQQEREAET